jgi:hypothetical protein
VFVPFGKNISKFRGITTLTRKQKDSLRIKIPFHGTYISIELASLIRISKTTQFYANFFSLACKT